jgi:hypothetical protein
LLLLWQQPLLQLLAMLRLLSYCPCQPANKWVQKAMVLV